MNANIGPKPRRAPAESATRGSLLRWGGLIVLLAVAVMRCLIFFAPQVVFDTDPATDPTPLIGLGPAGSMVLDVILMLACAAALLGERAAGRRLNWTPFVLAVLPLPIILWHGSQDAGDLWLGSAWLAAAIAAAAVVHLGRDRRMRIMIVAVLLATLAPLLARGVVQLTREHPAAVELFEQQKDQFLLDRGWPPDSPAAKIYERRLRQPQPTSWFTTTNVYASFMAFGLVLALGLVIAAVKSKMEGGWSGVMFLLAAAAGAMLWLSGSKGAVLATFAGLALLAIVFLVRSPGINSRLLQWAGVLFIALTLLAVIVRGTALPESFIGEKSLLFRWHYMAASAAMFADHAVQGVGPGGYQAAYTFYRLPRNPEEVTSAHSMFWDWLCTLGISGSAWGALALWCVWHAGRQVDPNMRAPSTQNEIASTGSPIHSLALHLSLALVFIGIVPAIIVEWPALDGIGLLARALGIAGFCAITVIAAVIADSSPPRAVNAALLAAVVALLVHGQIEMTFVQPGAVAWTMCALGIAAAGGGRDDRTVLSRAGLGSILAVLVIVTAAGWITLRGVVPAVRQERMMLRAAAALGPLRANSTNVELMLRLRRSAATILVEAYRAWPANVQPLEAAANQLLLASSQPGGPQPVGLLLEARDLLRQAIEDHDRNSSRAMAIAVNMHLAMLVNDAEFWQEAIALAGELTQRDPNGLSAWRRRGDALWAAGERAEAARAYQRALECDANFELDVLKQLSDSQRATLRQRIAETQRSLE